MSMEYKGYVAGPIAFDAEEGVFSGTVQGLKDIIHFEGTNAQELLESFQAGIDDYLSLCAERGEAPDKAYSGKMLVRATADLHRKADLRARAEGVSISEWISRQIAAAP